MCARAHSPFRILHWQIVLPVGYRIDLGHSVAKMHCQFVAGHQIVVVGHAFRRCFGVCVVDLLVVGIGLAGHLVAVWPFRVARRPNGRIRPHRPRWERRNRSQDDGISDRHLLVFGRLVARCILRNPSLPTH